MKYKVTIKMNQMYFKSNDSKHFRHYNWPIFSANDEVFESELFCDAECRVKKINHDTRSVIVEFAPELASEVNQFLKYVTCIGIK